MVKRKNNNKSAKIVFRIFALVIVLLISNIIYLGATGNHFVSGKDIKEYANSRGGGQKEETLYAKRGSIYSSDNEVIASDVKKYKLIAYLNESRHGVKNVPAYVQEKDKEACAQKLSKIIELSESKILKKLQSNAKQVEFGTYGDELTENQKKKIESLDYSGLKLVKSSVDSEKYKLVAVLDTTSTTVKNVPAYVQDKDKKSCAKKLSKIIGMSYKKVLNKLNSHSYQVEFGTYGNNLSSITKDKIDALGFTGLEFEEVRSRNYRYGDFASYQIGYAQLMNNNSVKNLVGQMGIEKTYNDQLTGQNGKKVYLVDADNYILPNGVLSEEQPVAGNDIYLTIDSDVQTELDIQLKKLVKKMDVDKAAVAVMGAKTGKILAVSNYPSFNPNKKNIDNYVDLFFNEAVEPGSVFKTFVYANALNDKKLNLNETFQSGVYNYKVNGRLIKGIRDHNEGRGWGRITYENGYYHSSNTAICNILTKYTNKNSLIQDYKDLKFFQSSTIDGIQSGSGVAGFKGQGKNLEWLTTGFGQGSTFTGLQLLRAYSAFANDGKTVEPYIVEKIVNPQTNETVYQAESQYSKKIYSTETVNKIRKLMSGVVNKKGGTGYNYHMNDIHLIGKTGTGQVAKNGKYLKNYNTHGFVGLAPYDDPEVVIVSWYQNSISGSKAVSQMIKAVTRCALNKLNTQETKTVKTSTYDLDSYLNQSTKYVQNVLTSHQVTPIFIGDGQIVIDQYPRTQTEVAAKSRVFLKTNGTKITMPSMEGWSRKEVEAFASMAGVEIDFDGLGIVYKQSISKGTVLKSNQKITVYAK